MKAIVVYYSLEGHSKYVADRIAKILKADTLRLQPVKPYPTGGFSKYFWGGRSAIFGDSPELKPYVFNKTDYDVIILGTPVWASNLTPPIKTFLEENSLEGKKIGLFACSAGGNAVKCLQKMKQKVGITEEVPTLSLMNPEKQLAESDNKKIEDFCKKLLS